ncbi:MAG TPA: CRISPR-associated protein Cas4 [Bacillota bacterium]|nr:CRISPR-associated protein Cas4 [Bacillota bacterium]HQA66133.1 CRISPR-associated protein Cas4 [Bacillota bacterium]HQQ43611.1 CRISPR-associated protein Cas4 [Bacillota bacterium]
MSYSEEDLIPISYLSQYYYCHRRAGLLLLEEQWNDNVHTAEGSVMHERVHAGGDESRGDIIITRSLYLRSFELGLSGIADVIEFHASSEGFEFPWMKGRWCAYPVEYKHGEKRDELEYEVQLCAQAICLEEMANCKVQFGYIYYGSDRRRKKVFLNDDLRSKVQKGAESLHIMMKSKVTPHEIKSPKCRECSMVDICLPGKLKSTRNYLDMLMHQIYGDDDV